MRKRFLRPSDVRLLPTMQKSIYRKTRRLVSFTGVKEWHTKQDSYVMNATIGSTRP